ncbi:hypothetical protein N7454_002132 [Penicillium verhagenii]|nr:hypothetical protein N7454_002132 [Penicillium verhagenii]
MSTKLEHEFSGAAGENIQVYLLQCKHAWTGVGMSEEEKSEARAVTVFKGLRGDARLFVNSLSTGDLVDFSQLSKRLTERFPVRATTEEDDAILKKINALSQKGKSLSEYIAEAQELKVVAHGPMQETLARKWCQGLNDHQVAAAISIKMASWKNQGHLHVDSVIREAREALG